MEDRQRKELEEKALEEWKKHYISAIQSNVGFPKNIGLNKLTNPRILGFVAQPVIKSDLSLKEQLIKLANEQLSVEYINEKHYFVGISDDKVGYNTYALLEIE